VSIADRHPAGRSRQSAEARPVPLLRRLLSTIRRRLWGHGSPPYADKHLCRDIGIEQPPREELWPWPWHDRRP